MVTINTQSRNIIYLAQNWNNIFAGVQKYVKNNQSEVYKSIKHEVEFYQYTVFNIIKETNILEEKEEVYKTIIEFLCYAKM